MIEQKLERKILDKFQALFAAAAPDAEIQYIGSLQVSEARAIEDDSACVFTVHVNPRGYDSPMVPTCAITCTISLAVRADADPTGALYTSLMNAALNQLNSWQGCMQDVHEEFDIADEFTLAGFRLAEGATPLDTNKQIWTYAHSFELQGVVTEAN